MFSVNVWSAGELTNTLANTEYLSQGAPSISTDWSDIGNKSIKFNGNWIRFPVTVTAEYVGKTATVKAKVYIPTGSVTAHIMSNDTVKSSVTVPSTNDTQFADVLLTTAVLEDSEYIKINFSADSTLIYIDSIEMYIS